MEEEKLEHLFCMIKNGKIESADALKEIGAFMQKKEILNQYVIHRGGGKDKRYYAYFGGKKLGDLLTKKI